MDLMHALKAYNLTKAETLQIVNCPPLSIVELWLVSQNALIPGSKESIGLIKFAFAEHGRAGRAINR